jgi:hypothetical protein
MSGPDSLSVAQEATTVFKMLVDTKKVDNAAHRVVKSSFR